MAAKIQDLLIGLGFVDGMGDEGVGLHWKD